MNKLNHKENSALKIILVTLLLSIAYAVIRYHIAGSVPWKDFPFFILNKGIALGAYILLTFTFTFGPMKNLGIKIPTGYLNARKALGMVGFLIILVHFFMSVLMFSPSFYGKFFEPDGTLTMMAGLSMLGGILSFVVLWAYNLSFQTFLREDTWFIELITSRSFLLTAMLFGAVHLFFMGYKGWINPSGWHGGLPPISLVAFSFFAIGYVTNLFGRK